MGIDLGTVYINTLLANLNAREFIRNHASSDVITSSGMEVDHSMTAVQLPSLSESRSAKEHLAH